MAIGKGRLEVGTFIRETEFWDRRRVRSFPGNMEAIRSRGAEHKHSAMRQNLA